MYFNRGVEAFYRLLCSWSGKFSHSLVCYSGKCEYFKALKWSFLTVIVLS